MGDHVRGVSRFLMLKRNRTDVSCLFKRGASYPVRRGIAELPRPREEFLSRLSLTIHHDTHRRAFASDAPRSCVVR
jgi:hypothetical protein